MLKEILLRAMIVVLQRAFPPLNAAVVARLQAERMACSWFSLMQKSGGEPYGFLSFTNRLLLRGSLAAVSRATAGSLA